MINKAAGIPWESDADVEVGVTQFQGCVYQPNLLLACMLKAPHMASCWVKATI